MFNLTRRKPIDQHLDESADKKVPPAIRKSQDELDFNVKIGAKLKSIRVSKNLSGKEVGESIPKSVQQYYKYESGENSLTVFAAIEVCKILGISINDLLLDEHYGEPELLVDERHNEIMSLIRNYTSIGNPAFKKMIRKMALSLSKESPIDKNKSVPDVIEEDDE